MKFIICNQCHIERPERDFFKSLSCYKCVLHLKKLQLSQKKDKPKQCGICTSFLPKNRWVYCSKECADIAEMKRQKNYWLWNM